MKTIEELAEMHQNALAKSGPHPAWSAFIAPIQAGKTKAMQAAITAFLESAGEGMPSARDCVEAGCAGGYEAVRNLMLAAHAKAVAEKDAQHEAQLAAVRALPERWVKDSESAQHIITVRGCAAELEAALATTQPAPAVEPVPEVDPYAELKAAAERGEWIQRGISKDEWELPVQRPKWNWQLPAQCYRIVPTFQAHGKTWFRHTPGDEMPVGPDVEVCVLLRQDLTITLPGTNTAVPAGTLIWGAHKIAGWEIIGYYPTSLAEALGNVEKPLEHHQPPADSGLVLHNPLGLTAEQVGPSHRLLCTIEKRQGEYWNSRNEWHAVTSRSEELSNEDTYRVPLSTPWPTPKEEPQPDPRDAEIARLEEEASRLELLRIRQIAEAGNRITELESRLAALTPRPVSVKPTREDADTNGDVILFDPSAGDFTYAEWDSKFPATITHWLPGKLARFAPELMPKPEDKERAEFETAWEQGLKSVTKDPKSYAFEVWQTARKLKEAA